MELILRNTSQIVDLGNGLQGRVWEGTSEGGVEVTALIVRVAIAKDADSAAFDRELVEKPPVLPNRPQVFDARMF